MPWDESLISSLKVKEPAPNSGRILSYSDAIREALDIAMTRDKSVFVLGQGVDDPGAMFGTCKGLSQKYGGTRVFDTPVAEDSMTGVCVGAAMNGMRPVYMHNRPDFILLTFNQLVTHASKYHYMDNGTTNVPMVVWAAIGRGWGSGAQHSQSIQGLLLGVPGLKIVMPTTPADAKGLMLAAIEDNNPVLIFEHRWLMKQKGVVPEGFYKTPIGMAEIRKSGKDLTIVATSHCVDLAEKSVEDLAAKGISAELIDLRTIKPIDEKTVLDSVRKTGRLVVTDTGWAIGGVCAEIGCMVAEHALKSLKAPVKRVALPDGPTPAGFYLEQYYYPTSEKITAAALEICK